MIRYFVFILFATTVFSSDDLQQSKELMNQGKRRQAVQLIDQLIIKQESLRPQHGRRKRKKNNSKELKKRKVLYLEQFLTSDAFQKYQDALELQDSNRLDEAISELDSISEKDQNNVLVLRLRSDVLFGLKKYEQSMKALEEIQSFLPEDVQTALSMVEINLIQGKNAEAMTLLSVLHPMATENIERFSMLKARALEATGDAGGAIETLKKDQEDHLDHIQSIYELGMLYARTPGYDWQARKMLSLFLSRCKRLSEQEKKHSNVSEKMKRSQDMLDKLNKKLGI